MRRVKGLALESELGLELKLGLPATADKSAEVSRTCPKKLLLAHAVGSGQRRSPSESSQWSWRRESSGGVSRWRVLELESGLELELGLELKLELGLESRSELG